MHYYQHNIGDYARDTGHLSILEHGIYRLLLDWCYLNEKPITTEQAIRVGRGNPVETQSVLSEFFLQSDEGWTHKRVSQEIEKYHRQAEKNRQNGLKGGRPKPKNNPVGSQWGAKHNPNQEPITNNQEPIYTPKPPRGSSDLFEDFWKQYPKKVGKDAAKKAFEKRKPDKALLKTMLDSLEVQKKLTSWTTEDMKYVPNPATWLNQGRWMDELENKQPEDWRKNPFFAGAI